MSTGNTLTLNSNKATNLKRYVVHIAGYGKQTLLAESLAQLLVNIEWLRSQGLSLTIVCEERRLGC